MKTIRTTTTVMVPLTVEVALTPGRPARLSGPPENCYPAEAAEVESWSVVLRPEMLMILRERGIAPSDFRAAVKAMFESDVFVNLNAIADELAGNVEVRP